MKNHTLLTATFAVILFLLSCRVNEGLPEAGRAAIDDVSIFYSKELTDENFQFKIVSAQKAIDVTDLIISAPLPDDLTSGRTLDEVWCVVIDPPAEDFLSPWGLRPSDRFLVVRNGEVWEALPMLISLEYRDVWQEIGCDNWSDGIRK